MCFRKDKILDPAYKNVKALVHFQILLKQEIFYFSFKIGLVDLLSIAAEQFLFSIRSA